MAVTAVSGCTGSQVSGQGGDEELTQMGPSSHPRSLGQEGIGAASPGNVGSGTTEK